VPGRIAALALAASLACGCGGAIVLRREVPRPAAVPARSYPVVYVAGAPDGASRDAADAIAAHLEGSRARIVRVSAAELLASAAAETVPTLALLITVSLGEHLDTRMSAVPMSRCTPGLPCGYPGRTPIDLRAQTGVLEVRALDPRSASELGRVAIEEEEVDPNPLTAQLAVLTRLRTRACTLFDVVTELHDLELDPLEGELARVIADAQGGAIHEARLQLGERMRDPSLDDATRAAVTFDYAQLVRLDVDPSAADTVEEESARFDAAENALVTALRLAPTERHQRALDQLRAERLAREDVRAQEAATDANFGTTP
jgi:hypothetical protein